MLTPPLQLCHNIKLVRHINSFMTTSQENVSSASFPKREFYVVIERDEDGLFVGEVMQLPACYSQGETIDELMVNIREVIELCLEELQDETLTEFIGIQKIVL
jgi:predicted RNase H-like HicB family nuclease